MPIPVILQVNCGYARAAIRELSSPEEQKSRKEIAFEGCRQNFLSLFSSVTTYGIPEEYQISGNRNFNNTCETTSPRNGTHQANGLSTCPVFQQKIGSI